MSADSSKVDVSAAGFWTPAKPNWDSWKSKTRCLIWQAAALSCDVDPNIFRPIDLISRNTEGRSRMPVPESLRQLLEMVGSAVGSGTLRVIGTPEARLIESEVELVDFAKWLQTIGHAPPKEFQWTPRIANIGEGQGHTTLKKAALIKKYTHSWRKIESDFRHAHQNGLANAAKTTSHGYWNEDAAVRWATENGKLEKSASPLSPNLFQSTGTVHRL